MVVLVSGSVDWRLGYGGREGERVGRIGRGGLGLVIFFFIIFFFLVI